jgi:hypothetical protein
MNGIVIGFPLPAPVATAAAQASSPAPAEPAAPVATPPAGVWRLRPNGLQMDFKTLLGKLERTMAWLDRHRIEVVAFSCSTLQGAKVGARDSGRLRQLLADGMHSKGHRQFSGVRFEQWEARDPVTGVLIVWEEERQEGRP